MRRFFRLGRIWAQGLLVVTALASVSALAQSSPTPQPTQAQTSRAEKRANAAELPDTPQPEDYANRLITLPRQLLKDQIGLWTSPARARISDAAWLVPVGGLTAALFATDRDVSRHLSTDPNTLLRYKHVSDYGLYSMVGASGGLYLLGSVSHNRHQRETGFLAGESLVNSLGIIEAIKYASSRQRPFEGNGNGDFRSGGVSFPSEHAAASWAVAGIIAHEYPSPLMKFLSYGAATAISASRINARQHFPSDVLVGMALGYLTSEYVYHHHHDPDLEGAAWELPQLTSEAADSPTHFQTRYMGSPYVPLDSWIYPAFDRLAALGYIKSGFADMRPWTRLESARQLEEALDRITDESEESEGPVLYRDLASEFRHETSLLGGGNNSEVRLESAYSRSTVISGKPLTDGDHFGQTIINDYGRPEQRGFNNVSGASAWASIGPFVAYANGEFQHSPSTTALPLSAREAISQEDFRRSTVSPPYPVPSAAPTGSISEGHLLDAYVAMNLSDWELSYGKQSISWGPEQGGSLTLSNNADPIRMFRLNRVTPFKLPDFLGVIGPIRLEAFVGQFSGYEFLFTPNGLVGQYGQSLKPQPILHGERISVKPTPNLEIGISRTTDYGGPGYPLTPRSFFRSVFSTGNAFPGDPKKPGSRRSGLDFSYRLPGVRNGLTFYAEGLAEHNEVTPLLGPDVAAWLAGIYVPKVPGLRKLDFRAEGVYTDPVTAPFDVIYGAFYWDGTWITGYQNAKHLMGSWVGRQGQGTQVWTTYWFTPRNKLQFGYRHQKVSHQFVENGGTLTDANVRADLWVGSSFSVGAFVQYETWNFPVIANGQQSNVATSIEVKFWPKFLQARHTTE